jgi:DNA-binding transcriptional LysR family regulator
MTAAGGKGEMAAFVRSVELGGFSAAARELELTPSALSKLVTRMEERLGARLLNRTTRRLALTPEGELLFERFRKILQEIEDAENEVVRSRARPRGLLRINTFAAFRHQLVPGLPRFQERYPEVEVELKLEDRLVDLVKEGADLAVRMAPLEDSSLVARKICDLRRVICAAPAYLARHGTPRVPEDLAHHNCIVIAATPALARWPFDTAKGKHLIEVSGRLSTNSGDALKELAVAGLGIVRIVDMSVGEEIRKGALVPLLTDSHHVEPVPLHAVYVHGRHRSPKVAAMLDFLIENFARAPWRSAPPTTSRR